MNETSPPAEPVIECFPPIVPDGARLLILGTMPGVRSLADGFFYAHPQNAFWRILADAFAAPVPGTVPAKTALLQANAIALWDVAASCARAGSLDSAMRDIVPNDVGALLDAHPSIRRVLLNGGTAHALYRRLFGGRIGDEAVRLPSTSPAYTLNYHDKRNAWRAAITDKEEGHEPR